MSHTSYSIFDEGTTLKQVREIVYLLGYVKVRDGLTVPNRTDCTMWFEQKDYKSWVGVELDIYKENNKVNVTTRSRISRSHWDLTHQNNTLKTLRDLFGGYFETDAGRNRYLRSEGKPPLPISSGCYLARWRFNNALIKPRLYLSQRGLKGQNAKPEPIGLHIFDEMNPRLFSNNLILPYLVAIWEEYFKSSFIVLLKYSSNRETVLKKSKLSHAQLEEIAAGVQGVEEALTESLSFQRPSKVSDNFKLINQRLDIAGILRKPYRRRRTSLYESIEKCVEIRNEFVHSGYIDTTMSDKVIEKIIDDFEVAVDRIYDLFGEKYEFVPLRYY